MERPTHRIHQPAAVEQSDDRASRPSVVSASGSRWPRRIALLTLAALTGIAAAYGTRFGTDPTIVDSPLIGQPLPDVTLPYLEQDGTLTPTDLRGDIVVVNFWASWCTACREEHDDLIMAAQRSGTTGSPSSASSTRTAPRRRSGCSTRWDAATTT